MAISGLVWTSFGVFLVPLQTEFGWSRGEVSAAFSVFALSNAASAPVIGHAMRRWDSRMLLAGLSVLLGFALIATALVSHLTAYWLIFGVLGGIGSQSVSSFAIFAILARRVRRRPASAMSVADAGSGLAVLLGLPLVQWIITELGWRVAYMFLGMTVLLVGVVLHLLVLDPALRPLPGPSNATGGSPRSGKPRERLLPVLLLAASFFFGSAAYHGLMTQQIALLHEEGIPTSVAIWFAAAAGGSVFIWRLLSGWMADLLGPNRVMFVACCAILVTFGGLSVALAQQNLLALLLYPLAMGVGFGGQQVILAIALRQLVAPDAFPVRLSYCRLASGFGMATGPVAAGLASDSVGGFAPVAALLAFFAVAHCILYGIAASRG